MKFFGIVLVIAAALCLAVPAQAQEKPTDVSGAWKLTIDTPMGSIVSDFTIKLDGEKDGNINYRFSAERRNAVDFNTKVPTDKPDRSFKNYLQAHKAYKVATGRDPVNTGEIAAYLRDFEHKLRITQFNGRNMVVSITATPPQMADA